MDLRATPQVGSTKESAETTHQVSPIIPTLKENKQYGVISLSSVYTLMFMSNSKTYLDANQHKSIQVM